MEKLQPQQLQLETPDDHFRTITSGVTCNPHGTVLVGWQPLKQPKWFKCRLAKAQDQLAKYTNEPDIYLTPNLFYGWRLIRLLKEITSFYVDIDDHTSHNPDPMRMLGQAEEVIYQLGLPAPNFAVYSGRGIHLYWLLNNVPPQALPRWRAVQRVLCNALGGDPHACDPTRLLRTIGTRNSKTDTRVVAEPFHQTRYDFNWFCDEVLPYSQAEVRDFRAAQARRSAVTKQRKNSTPRKVAGSIYDRWYLVYQDLMKIQNHFWFGGMREAGHRDQMLFHTANALSWFTCSDALESEIRATAQIMTPSLSLDEALSYCSSVVRRAKKSAAGADEHRYKYRRITLWRAFEPLIAEHPDLVQELRAIIPDELAAERQAERQANRNRAAEGRYKKKTATQEDVAKQKRSIRRWLSQGVPKVEIAARLGMSKQRLNTIIKSMTKNKP